MEKQYLRPEEVAECWDVSRGLVCKLLREGKLTGAKVGGVWRVRPCDIYDYEKRVRNSVRRPVGKIGRI